MSIDTDILEHLTDEWQTPRLLWHKIDRWVENTIATRCKLMADEGKIEACKEPMKRSSHGFRWTYRRLKQGGA